MATPIEMLEPSAQCFVPIASDDMSNDEAASVASLFPTNEITDGMHGAIVRGVKPSP